MPLRVLRQQDIESLLPALTPALSPPGRGRPSKGRGRLQGRRSRRRRLRRSLLTLLSDITIGSHALENANLGKPNFAERHADGSCVGYRGIFLCAERKGIVIMRNNCWKTVKSYPRT